MPGSSVGGQGVRYGERLLALVRTGLAVDGNGAGCDYLVATGGVLVGDPAGVHDLGENAAALGVHGGGDVGPARELLVGHEAGLAREAAAGVAGVGALTDDQAKRGALAVVFDHQRAGDSFFAGADTGKRRHDESVG